MPAGIGGVSPAFLAERVCQRKPLALSIPYVTAEVLLEFGDYRSASDLVDLRINVTEGFERPQEIHFLPIWPPQSFVIRHMKGEAKLGLELGVVIDRPEFSGIFTNLRPI